MPHHMNDAEVVNHADRHSKLLVKEALHIHAITNGEPHSSDGGKKLYYLLGSYCDLYRRFE